MSVEPLSNLVELEPKSEAPAKKNEREVYRLIDANLGNVGGIESAAEIMGLDRGDLRRALDGGKGRYLAVEHVMRFAERLRVKSPESAQRIAVAIMRPFDMVVAPRVQMTAAEQARRARKKMDAMSAVTGVDLWAQAMEES